SDVEAAVSALERSVALTTDPGGLPRRLNGLAWVLIRRFEISGGLDDLDRATELAGRAVASEPAPSPEHLPGVLLLVRCTLLNDRGGGLAALERAFDTSGLILQRAPRWSAVAQDTLVQRYIAALTLSGHPGQSHRLLDALDASERLYVNAQPGS